MSISNRSLINFSVWSLLVGLFQVMIESFQFFSWRVCGCLVV